MKKYWKVIGIVVVAAGILYYPALKLYQYITRQKGERHDDEEEHHVKFFLPAYRGKRKPHHRHAPDGDGKTNIA